MTNPKVVTYPGDVSARYLREGLWCGGTLIQQWQEVADTHPEREAVVSIDGRLSYAELSERTDRIAAGLLELGLTPGERVLFQVTNRLATVLAWYGVLKAGLVPVCTLAAHRHHEISELAARSGAAAHLVEVGAGNDDLVGFATRIASEAPAMRVLLTVAAEASAEGVRIEDLAVSGDAVAARERVRDVQQQIRGDDVAVLQLSGGTTGTPKLIPRLHDEYWYNARQYARVLGWDASVRTVHVFPILHNAGVVCGLHGPHSVGGTAVVVPPDKDALPGLLDSERITDIAVIGHAFASLAEEMIARGHALRRVILTGSKPPDGVFRAFDSAGIWVGQLFGMAEGMFLVTPLDAPREAREFSVGVPMSPLDEAVLLEPGSLDPVPDGELGELCCRGPYTVRGYYDAAQQNAEVFTAEGFYRTGDLAVAGQRGGLRSFSIEGRIKDVIDRGGEKINAEEIEALLVDHPGIDLASVVAMPDAELGERACAYVVAAPGATPTLESVKEYLHGRGVAKFKWPERVEVIDALPRTAVGKINKKALRADIAGKIAAATEVRV